MMCVLNKQKSKWIAQNHDNVFLIHKGYARKSQDIKS